MIVDKYVQKFNDWTFSLSKNKYIDKCFRFVRHQLLIRIFITLSMIAELCSSIVSYIESSENADIVRIFFFALFSVFGIIECFIYISVDRRKVNSGYELLSAVEYEHKRQGILYHIRVEREYVSY